MSGTELTLLALFVFATMLIAFATFATIMIVTRWAFPPLPKRKGQNDPPV